LVFLKFMMGLAFSSLQCFFFLLSEVPILLSDSVL
jgi:hypothetical protein